MIIPGVPRRIDPDAEVHRLSEERKRATDQASWPLISDEIYPVQRPDGSLAHVRIRVNADGELPLPAETGARIAAAIHVQSAFGPLSPILPVPVDDPEPGERPGPRPWNYPVGGHPVPPACKCPPECQCRSGS